MKGVEYQARLLSLKVMRYAYSSDGGEHGFDFFAEEVVPHAVALNVIVKNKINNKRKALLYMKHGNPYVREYCKNLLRG